MPNFDDFQQANASFASSFQDGDKPMPPARKALVITCMDGAWSAAGGGHISRLAPGLPPPPATTLHSRTQFCVFLCFMFFSARIHPEKALGVAIGDIHVVRNAGGRAIDAVRSVTISQQLLGTEEVCVSVCLVVPPAFVMNYHLTTRLMC